MRTVKKINSGWLFHKNLTNFAEFNRETAEKINVPHNWNSIDGQDGGGDYFRGTCGYIRKINKSEFGEGAKHFVEFKGVNSCAEVYFNGVLIGKHEGGYSTFRCEIKNIQEENELLVMVDNSENLAVYPHKADFTFYGGIYRDVNLISLPENHFEMMHFGDLGMKISTKIVDGKGVLNVEANVVGEGKVVVGLYEQNGNLVQESAGNQEIIIENPHLWNGLEDPYLYFVKVQLVNNDVVEDEIEKRVGFRTFRVDPKEGFFLNDKKYPLRGVCRHQDRKGMGNSITKVEHDEDFEMIREIGANTIRLAHYQHDDYIYDLCDQIGLVVWAEIPYISMHSDAANANAEQQMRELVYQQYHHASIVCWGTSNEITMFRGHQKQLVKENQKLNEICHEIDPNRLTTLACFAMCSMGNKIAKVTDLVSWNFYFGWYTPFMFLNKLWFGFYHMTHPKRCVGLSEYGAEAMTNLHSQHPHRGDSTEEYHCKYHEYMLEFFAKRDYLWATHVWNMFDFGSDGRNQGGDPGVNHKGLVTFDRKTKKDSFYLYKSYWSKEPTLYIAEKRMQYRTGNKLIVKVYTNQDQVELFNNGISLGVKGGTKVLTWKIPFEKIANIQVKANDIEDKATFLHSDKPVTDYKLQAKSNNYSWEKK